MPRSILLTLAAVDGEPPGLWLKKLWDKVGQDILELSRQLDVRPQAAIGYLRRYALPYDAPDGKLRRRPEDWYRRRAILNRAGYKTVREAVEDVVRRGLGPSPASRLLGVTPRTIQLWAGELGMSLKPPAGQKRKGAYQTDLSHLRTAHRAALSTRVTLPDGSTEELQVLADRMGVTRQAMKYRINKWGVQEALSRPIRTSSGRRRSTWSAK